jgi:hypothetical protein
MGMLCARLQDVKEAGAYKLSCKLEDLRADAAQAGFTLFDADLEAVHSKGLFLAAVAQAVRAPDWFGTNWDALADALGDLSWQPAAGYVLLLRNGGETLGLTVADRDIATEIFAATVDFWKSQGKPFWIFFC